MDQKKHDQRGQNQHGSYNRNDQAQISHGTEPHHDRSDRQTQGSGDSQQLTRDPAEGSRENVNMNDRDPGEERGVGNQREQKGGVRHRREKATSGHSTPTDVGRTSGGGSLGHEQPSTVEERTNTRNNTGRRTDPVMPADDATLKKRI